jgi:4a-hydroxytetrahydrobiopterin dehydratase
VESTSLDHPSIFGRIYLYAARRDLLNSDMELHQKKCKPCEGGTPPLSIEESRNLLAQVQNWELKNGRIEKSYRFRDFNEAIRFVNRVAELAESEGHHPDIYVSWNRVVLSLTTHVIGGLSDNDFILASKIDRL